MATVYPFRQPAAPLPEASTNSGPSRLFDQPFSEPHDAAPIHTFNLMRGFRRQGLETRLRQFEAAARQKFLQAVEDLPETKLAGWFSRQLEHKIIPALTRIGFDESLARILFQAAAPGWQRMGLLTDKCIRFSPDLIRNLNAIRQEKASKADSTSDTSWIILPRVYQYLEEDESAYLLCYLQYLAGESTPEFRRILTRVVIEFVGNYALKYRSRLVSGCRMDAAVFYGYAAMFWKNLRKPPPGFEDDLIFNHCLRWIKLFRSRCADLNDDMKQNISRMEVFRRKVMLLENNFDATENEDPISDKLLLTLRHGRPGAQAAIDFMGNWLYSFRNDAPGRSISARLPSVLNTLLQTMTPKLRGESPEVQKSLHNCLCGLHEKFRANAVDKAGGPGISPAQFRFIMRRAQGLIKGMTPSPT